MTNINDTLNERAHTHGDYREQAAFAQQFKRMMRAGRNWERLELTQAQSLEAFADKISRVLCGNANEPDHWRDVAGYAQLIVRELEPLQGGARAPTGVSIKSHPGDVPLNVPSFILRDMERDMADVTKPKDATP
jgi:hypothetical protein